MTRNNLAHAQHDKLELKHLSQDEAIAQFRALIPRMKKVPKTESPEWFIQYFLKDRWTCWVEMRRFLAWYVQGDFKSISSALLIEFARNRMGQSVSNNIKPWLQRLIWLECPALSRYLGF